MSSLNQLAAPSAAKIHCNEQHSAKALQPNCRQPGAETLLSSLQLRNTLSEMPTTVVGNLTMRSCLQFCQASAPMSLMPDSMLTCRSRGACKGSFRDYFLWVHGDMNSKWDIIYEIPLCGQILDLRQSDDPLEWRWYLFAKCLFFHEYGRRVGMVPRSSLKEGKNRQMVEKGTKTPKPTQNQTPKPAGRNSTIL